MIINRRAWWDNLHFLARGIPLGAPIALVLAGIACAGLLLPAYFPFLFPAMVGISAGFVMELLTNRPRLALGFGLAAAVLVATTLFAAPSYALSVALAVFTGTFFALATAATLVSGSYSPVLSLMAGIGAGLVALFAPALIMGVGVLAIPTMAVGAALTTFGGAFASLAAIGVGFGIFSAMGGQAKPSIAFNATCGVIGAAAAITALIATASAPIAVPTLFAAMALGAGIGTLTPSVLTGIGIAADWALEQCCGGGHRSFSSSHTMQPNKLRPSHNASAAASSTELELTLKVNSAAVAAAAGNTG